MNLDMGDEKDRVERSDAEQLEILFRDDHLVAIHKPAGLLIHRSDIDRHETRFAVQLLRNQLRQRIYPIHRLDKPTSGIVLFALNSDTAGAVQAQFTQQSVSKTYLALVRGFTDIEGVIDYPLKRESVYKNPQPHEKNHQTQDAQDATTDYQTLGTTELDIPVGRYATSRYSLVELRPLTGRRHQLRRHLKHIYHPIIGDTTHGDGKHNAMFRERFNCHRLMLMARSLELTHPHTQKPLHITSGEDPDFYRLLNTLNLPLDMTTISKDRTKK